MAKLGSYNLNCALCDDMGLGKTLQSLTVVFNEAKRRQQSESKKGNKVKKPISLIVCPTSLTYNWLAEVNKFFTGFNAVVIESATKQ